MTNTPETNRIIKNLRFLIEKYDEKLLLQTVSLVAELLKSRNESTMISLNGIEEVLNEHDKTKYQYDAYLNQAIIIIKKFDKDGVKPFRIFPLVMLQVVYMVQSSNYNGAKDMVEFIENGHNKPFGKAVRGEDNE